MIGSVYVTTSIPYVNARPHIGHALELIQADVIARYHRLIGRPTRFQTGTDENAFKNVQSANDLRISVRELVDRNSNLFRRLTTTVNASADNFVRTTDEQHRKAVQHFWQNLNQSDVYIKKYSGLYCLGCEDFYLERDLVNGRCPDHGTLLIEVEEENYFFRLSAYQERLETLLETDEIRIIPETRKNEVLSFVTGGLRDISISRSSDRSGGWGIPVPGTPSQTIYVWIDALINYVSGLGYGTNDEWKKYWSPDALKVHVIGKDIWKFHAVYWPALLISAGLNVPDEIVVHGFLTENSQKISKSRGSTYDPFDVIKEYGVDTVRYYLLRGVLPFGDSDFSAQRLVEVYNADLANGLGNLVGRLITLAHKVGDVKLDFSQTPSAPYGYHETLRNYEFHNALKSLWEIVTQLNRDIDAKRPWEALREGNTVLLKTQLTEWFGELRKVGYWLKPFLPLTSSRILEILSGDPISTHPPLFVKINSSPNIS